MSTGLNMSYPRLFALSFCCAVAFNPGASPLAAARPQTQGESPAAADSAADAADAAIYTLPEVEVYGGEVAQAAFSSLVTRRTAPNAKSVIEGEQLHQFNDLVAGDAMRRLPGVTFAGVNRSRAIRLRGIDKAYTQVLLDGRTLLDGDASRNLEVDRLPSSLIERIEITRSPLASLPANGAAGTINIITRRDALHSDAAARGLSVYAGHLTGNGEQVGASAWASGGVGRIRYHLSAEARQRRVNESASELGYSGPARTPAGGEVEEQSRKFDETFLAARIEYRPGPSDRLSFAPTFSRSKEQREQQTYRLTADQTRFNRLTEEARRRPRQSSAAYAEWAHEFASGLSSRLYLDGQVGYQNTRRNESRVSLNSQGQPTGTPTIGQRLANIDLERGAVGLVLNQTLGHHEWEGGAGTARETRDEIETRNGTVSAARDYAVEEQLTHAYLSDSFPVFGKDRLTLGLRMEASTTETTDHDGQHFRRRAAQLAPSAQYKYTTLGDALDLRMGLARTLRRPDLRELSPTLSANSGTLSRPDTRGNPHARPEEIWGIDLGADWYLGQHGLLAVNLYGRDFAHKIESTLELEGTRWVRTPRNLGSGQLYGAELEARFSLAGLAASEDEGTASRADGHSPLRGLSLFANATAIHSELNDPLTGRNRRFDQTPGAVSNLGLDYHWPRWRTTLGLHLNTTWAYSQDIPQATNAPGIVQNQHTEFDTLHLLGLSLKMRLNPQWSLSLSATNLLRPADKRSLDIRDASGSLLSTTRSREPSYTTWALRSTFTW